MKKLEKTLLMVLSIIMMTALLVTGCAEENKAQTALESSKNSISTSGNENQSKETIKIGISFGTLSQERWSKEKEMMQAYADEIGGIELFFQAAESDASKQISQAENLVSQGIDVLLVVPQDGAAAAPIVEIAHESDVPVIAYDRMILNSDLDYYVSFDSVVVGEEMTKYALDLLPKGNYIVLKGDPADNNATLVYTGIMNVLQSSIDNGEVSVVSDQWCIGWSSEEALSHTENALSITNNDVQGVITSYDGLANGAIQALQGQQMSNVIVTGQDAELSACQRIVDGKQTMTIYKPVSELSRAGIDAAISLAKGERPAVNGEVSNQSKMVPSVLLEVIPIDKDNMYEKLIQTGYHKLEDVYANQPQEQWPQ